MTSRRRSRRRPPPRAASSATALIGFLVGVVPIALGLLWLPSLRRADPRWLAAFMALTAGLLSFLAVESLAEAFTLQALLPGALGGAGLVLLGVALSALGMTFLASRLARGRAGTAGLGLALLVAIGIGVHNLGEGLAIGTSFAVGELQLGTFLIVGFMIHNVTEGLGIAAPATEARRVVVLQLARPRRDRRRARRSSVPGSAATPRTTCSRVLFFGAAAGAALQVVVEVGRFVARRAPGGLRSGWVIGGYLAGHRRDVPDRPARRLSEAGRSVETAERDPVIARLRSAVLSGDDEEQPRREGGRHGNPEAFTLADARRIGTAVGIDWETLPVRRRPVPARPGGRARARRSTTPRRTSPTTTT